MGRDEDAFEKRLNRRSTRIGQNITKSSGSDEKSISEAELFFTKIHGDNCVNADIEAFSPNAINCASQQQHPK